MAGEIYAAAANTAGNKNGVKKLVGVNIMFGIESMLQRRGLSVSNARTEVNE